MKTVLKYGIVILFALIVMGYHAPAYPYGFGVYVNGTSGKTWYQSGRFYLLDPDDGILGEKGKISGAASIGYGGGLMMDTAPDSVTMVNYRMNLGYSRIMIFTGNHINLNRFDFTNTWGFKLYRNDSIKLWLGPQLGLNYLWGGDTHKTYEVVFNWMSLANPSLPISYKRKYNLFGVNTGLAIGVNINMSNRVTLSIEAGGRGFITFSGGEIDGSSPSGLVRGAEGYLLFGVLGRVH